MQISDLYTQDINFWLFLMTLGAKLLAPLTDFTTVMDYNINIINELIQKLYIYY